MAKTTPFGEVRQCLSILEPRDQKKYQLILYVQGFLGLLDLAGVAILGVIGSLAIRGIQSVSTGSRVSHVLQLFRLNNFSLHAQIAALGAIAVSTLVAKTLVSVFITRKVLFFLSHRTAEISADLTSRVFMNPKLGVQSENSHEIQYAIGPGVSAISIGVLGSASTVVADISLLFILGGGLFLYDQVTAIAVILLFSFVAVALYFLMYKTTKRISNEIINFNLESNKILFEGIQTYREIYVRDKRQYYINKISELRRGISLAQAEQAFLPNVSKYAVEITLILGSILLSGILFLTQDASHAFAGLALFLASGSRIGPSLLRLQQSLVQIQSSFVGALPALSMIRKIKSSQIYKAEYSKPAIDNFIPAVQICNLTFKYQDSDTDAVSDISLNIPAGKSLALVGPSGGGKSTLVDLILGIQNPDKGSITISGVEPSFAISEWPGKIAYVPQDVRIIDASISNNIALGFSNNEVNEERVQEVIRIAKLEDFVASLPNGINTGVGEFGARISGGQRQRLGIARALYSNPKLLVLDEATSALDGQTEAEVSEAIKSLRHEVTMILVAHRLSTVRDADIVVYLDRGLITAVGTFEEVRSQVPDFDGQAELMGL